MPTHFILLLAWGFGAAGVTDMIIPLYWIKYRRRSKRSGTRERERELQQREKRIFKKGSGVWRRLQVATLKRDVRGKIQWAPLWLLRHSSSGAGVSA